MQAAPPVAAPMVVSTLRTAQRKEHYMSKAVLVLSATQITIGALCFLLQLVLIGIQSPIHFVGQGIWTGVFFILTGAFGIASSKRKTTGLIVTFVTLAIISAVLTVVILAASSIDMVAERIVAFLALATISAVLTVGIITASSMDIGLFHYYHRYHQRHKVVSDAPLGINAVMLILAVTQAVVAIISSALGCHGLCGGNQNQSVVMVGQVQYIQGPDGQQQMVLLPLHQQEAGLAAGPSSHPGQAQLPPYGGESPPPQYECETKLPILE